MYNTTKDPVSDDKKSSFSLRDDLDPASKGKRLRISSIMNARSTLSNNTSAFDAQQDKTLEQLIALAVQLRDILGPSTEKILPLRTPLAALLDDLRVMQHSRRTTRMGCTPRAAIIGKEAAARRRCSTFC
ncbi:hypothetical protein STCU_10314 [Strigomonas culicis]|uniref:Uncharacterized protein n=1 Tax=Strigomonas culicis TaxID=28005 RepID=S9V4V6_9TRYP|nr:hypothetical protein STCU_10314 [Strigomonas culicis]|eukprot:EPY17925.1 hypothetical protein STCU_10314 [Strigomonas culicis]